MAPLQAVVCSRQQMTGNRPPPRSCMTHFSQLVLSQTLIIGLERKLNAHLYILMCFHTLEQIDCVLFRDRCGRI